MQKCVAFSRKPGCSNMHCFLACLRHLARLCAPSRVLLASHLDGLLHVLTLGLASAQADSAVGARVPPVRAAAALACLLAPLLHTL